MEKELLVVIKRGFLFLLVLIVFSSCVDKNNKKNYVIYSKAEDCQTSITYPDLLTQQGKLKKIDNNYKIAVLVKFLGNQYWLRFAKGVQKKAESLNLNVEIQSARNELDNDGQLKKMLQLLNKKPNAIIYSALSVNNLDTAIIEARKKGIILLNINEIGNQGFQFLLTPNQYECGVLAANYFLKQFPEGGKVALIKGKKAVIATEKRSAGFRDSLRGSPLTIIKEVYCDWDLQKAHSAALSILKDHPDLIGFYCNNDNMALGVNQAVLNQKQIIIGTDGIGPAYQSIAEGGITATIDSFPEKMGEAALDCTLRILEGHEIPPLIHFPQKLIDRKQLESKENQPE